MAKRITTAYSFEDVSLTIGGAEAYAMWEGDDAVMVEKSADVGDGKVGADGSSIFSQSTDRSATITVRFQHTSPTHRYLIQLLARQEGGALDGVAVSLRDRRSNEGGACEKAYIQRAAGDSKGLTATVREWVLWTGDWQRTIPVEF